jgi:hypothetical protein
MLIADDGFALRWRRVQRSDRARRIWRRQQLQPLRLDDETFRRNLIRRCVHACVGDFPQPSRDSRLAACLSGFRPACRIEATNGTQKLRFRYPMKRSTLPLSGMMASVF